MSVDPVREFVRHTVATIAYRGAKILRNPPEQFGEIRAGDPGTGTRSAREVLAHIGDLLQWTALLVRGEKGWKPTVPQSWDREVERFFEGLATVDRELQTASTPLISLEQIFQGPIADVLTHLGQISLLRRLAGSPVKGEPLIFSDIVPGKVGPEQTPPEREFG